MIAITAKIPAAIYFSTGDCVARRARPGRSIPSVSSTYHAANTPDDTSAQDRTGIRNVIALISTGRTVIQSRFSTDCVGRATFTQRARGGRA
eukprot:3933539-Rhodomonas_salina.4